jgi:glutamine synthetase
MSESDAARRADELAAASGVHTVEVVFPDTWGILRGKRLPASQFGKKTGSGLQIANAAFIWDPLCGIFDVEFANADTGYPDMIAWPDPSTFRPLTWREGTAMAMMDCREKDGRPVELDPRHLVRTAVERLAQHGYEATVATEIEFYLCDDDWQPLQDEIQCYSITKGAELEPVLSDIRRKVEAFGIVLEACNTEYGPAQIEINMKYGSPLQVADDTAIFKSAVKEIARQHGVRATFMSKPFPGYSGNGTHIHLSLRDADGENVFAPRDLDGDGFLTNALMRRCVAGLLAHQLEIAAIASPTVNAYKRFEDYSFAPTYLNWGGDNRGVAIRCVADAGPATRIEVRTGSADANPWILIAAQLMAVCDALETDHELPPMCDSDGYAVQERPLMPRTLQDSINHLREGRLLRDAFGDVFWTNTLELLQHEVDEFAKQVTDWEKNRYMEVS